MIKKEPFKEQVASELRSLRAISKLSQKEVADKANIDIMTVTRYENNSVSMQLDMIEKILTAYNIDIANFFASISANMQSKESN